MKCAVYLHYMIGNYQPKPEQLFLPRLRTSIRRERVRGIQTAKFFALMWDVAHT